MYKGVLASYHCTYVPNIHVPSNWLCHCNYMHIRVHSNWLRLIHWSFWSYSSGLSLMLYRIPSIFSLYCITYPDNPIALLNRVGLCPAMGRSCRLILFYISIFLAVHRSLSCAISRRARTHVSFVAAARCVADFSVTPHGLPGHWEIIHAYPSVTII